MPKSILMQIRASAYRYSPPEHLALRASIPAEKKLPRDRKNWSVFANYLSLCWASERILEVKGLEKRHEQRRLFYYQFSGRAQDAAGAGAKIESALAVQSNWMLALNVLHERGLPLIICLWIHLFSRECAPRIPNTCAPLPM